uniref:PNPLA domain-containing protein n=1 Tax=viral metagenome TaxID=1070528 RepID=A0A6C0CJA0_9ZZZZ
MFHTLGLGGGGVKGILHIGALLELKKHQELVFPQGVWGISVGSLVATYIAFGLPIDTLKNLNDLFSLKSFIPKLDIGKLHHSLTTKGVFSMDTFEKSVCDFFEDHGLDIKTKVLGDAQMPLFIIASNLTTGKPTIFSKNVPVMDALKCSCCIPGLFRPQILYNQIYIDGDVFCPSIDYLVPGSENVLCISLKKTVTDTVFTPKNIDSMSPLTYIHDIHSLLVKNFHDQVKRDCTVELSYPKLRSMSNIEEFDVEDILKSSGTALRDFLLSKGRL